MKKYINIFLVLFLSFNLQLEFAHGSLFNFKTKLERKSKRLFTKKLGIETISLSDKHDACALEQVKKWIHEYRRLDKNQKETLKQKFSAYKKINITSTITTAKLEGERYYLHFSPCYYYRTGRPNFAVCSGLGYGGGMYPWPTWSYYEDLKSIGEKITLTGKKPKTKIINQKDEATINIEPQKLVDLTTAKFWHTYNFYTYTRVQKLNDDEFNYGLNNFLIVYLGEEQPTHDTQCGLISLKDFAQEL